MSDAEHDWPREIWMAEREEYDQGVVSAVLSEYATVARFEGDTERDRDFHRYVDADIYETAERYWIARVAAAYEVAASICDEERHNMNAMFTNPPQSAAAVGSRNRIRALIDADALAALEAVKREARMEGFRAGFEQATICDFDDWKDAWAISKMNTAQEDAP